MASNLIADPSALIANAERVTSVYGGWPNFHDAEVLSLALDREGPSLVTRIWTFQVDRNELDSQGCYKRRKYSVITFRFAGVEDLVIEGFNIQNVLSAIIFEPSDKGLRVN